nr:hypothetical protein [Thermoanaerobacterales bacterium]
MTGRARPVARGRPGRVALAVLLTALAVGGVWAMVALPAEARPSQPDQTPTPTPAPPPPQATTTTAPTTPPTPSPQPGPSPEPPPATDGHQVDCPNEGPLAELAAVLDELPLVDLSRWAVGGTHRRTWNPPADLPDDVREWLSEEILTHKECSLIDATVLPRCDGSSDDGGSVLMPGTCVGAFPTTSYDLTFERSPWFSVDKLDDLLGYVMVFLFDIATLIIGAAIWLIGYALNWRLAGGLELPAKLAHTFQLQVVEPLQLERIAWLVLAGWVAFAVLRGKTAHGASEFLLSVVLAMLAVVVVNDITTEESSYIVDTVDTMDHLTAGVLLAGTGNDPRWDDDEPPSVEDAVGPLQRDLHIAFVDSAYDQLNWGRRVGLSGEDGRCGEDGADCAPDACIAAKEHILRIQDPNPQWAARHMERAGCSELASFNRQASAERTVAAGLNLVGALVLVALFGLLALTLLIAKFTLTLIFAATPFAAVAAVFPGAARRCAWVWLGALLQVFVVVVGTAALLTLLVVSVDTTLGALMGVNLFQRWVLVLVVLLTMFVLRRRLLAASRTLAGKFADSLTRLSPHNAGYQGGPVGANLTGAEDFAARSYLTRRIERRVARRSLRNLEIMERTRERGNINYEYVISGRSGSSGTRAPTGVGGAGGRPTALPGGGPRALPRGGASTRASGGAAAVAGGATGRTGRATTGASTTTTRSGRGTRTGTRPGTGPTTTGTAPPPPGPPPAPQHPRAAPPTAPAPP